MKNLEETKFIRGISAAIFTLKEKILGKKKIGQEQVMVLEPETRKELYSPNEIKEASLNYCVNLLKKNEPNGKFAKDALEKRELHNARLLERFPDESIISKLYFSWRVFAGWVEIKLFATYCH